VFTEQLTQSLAVVAQIPCSNHTNNTDTSANVADMSVFRRVITYLDVGATTGGNVSLYYYSSANSNMAGSTNLGNATGYNVTTANGNTANRVLSLEVRADQLPAGHRYVRPVLTVGAAAVNVGLICLGGECAYKPASQFNTANVLDASSGAGGGVM
jgi:hypothetical protein